MDRLLEVETISNPVAAVHARLNHEMVNGIYGNALVVPSDDNEFVFADGTKLKI